MCVHVLCQISWNKSNSYVLVYACVQVVFVLNQIFITKYMFMLKTLREVPEYKYNNGVFENWLQ